MHKRIFIPIEIVKMDDGGCHIFTKCLINDVFEANMLIDSGATKSVFDKSRLINFYKNLKSKKNFQSKGINAIDIETSLGKFDKISFGELVIANYKTVFISLDEINLLYQQINAKEIYGLIGGDFLNKYKAIINYKKRIVELQINIRKQ